jgi:murein DD-endopeptidase MepM/ murein hydrolase activator NlpD
MPRTHPKQRLLALAAGLLVGSAITIGATAADENGAAEPVLDPFVVAAADEPETGPFHPVRGPLDYGDAEAAFGSARGRAHEGQDIFAPTGAAMLAPTDGRVVEVGSDGGRGNWVAIHDGTRDRTFVYLHLREPAEVGIGDRVRAGRRVGRLGCTGSCFGDHLHFEVRRGRGPYGAAVDPLPLLQRWARAAD